MCARRVITAGLLTFGVLWTIMPASQVRVPTATERGKVLYERHCATCHGVDGHADTPVGRLLSPKPRNFSDPVEMARVTIDRMYQAIKEGHPGTAMAPWGGILSETQIGDVIDYIRSLASSLDPRLSPEQVSLEIGRRIYERECVLCHGRDGRARTDAAKALKPPPHNLADPIEMARIDDGRMYAAIKLGIRGTGMAGWGELLTPAEIIDLMRYVRSLEQPLPTGMTRAELDIAVGKQIYERHCAACHGDHGDGNTPLGRALAPRPRDFTQADMAQLPDAYLTHVIATGKPGTAMAPWRGVLNPDDAQRVLRFIRRTFQRAP